MGRTHCVPPFSVASVGCTSTARLGGGEDPLLRSAHLRRLRREWHHQRRGVGRWEGPHGVPPVSVATTMAQLRRHAHPLHLCMLAAVPCQLPRALLEVAHAPVRQPSNNEPPLLTSSIQGACHATGHHGARLTPSHAAFTAASRPVFRVCQPDPAPSYRYGMHLYVSSLVQPAAPEHMMCRICWPPNARHPCPLPGRLRPGLPHAP